MKKIVVISFYVVLLHSHEGSFLQLSLQSNTKIPRTYHRASDHLITTDESTLEHLTISNTSAQEDAYIKKFMQQQSHLKMVYIHHLEKQIEEIHTSLLATYDIKYRWRCPGDSPIDVVLKRLERKVKERNEITCQLMDNESLSKIPQKILIDIILNIIPYSSRAYTFEEKGQKYKAYFFIPYEYIHIHRPMHFDIEKSLENLYGF